MDSPEQVSPELVLVSPELAERARALLPDRPWEAFVPPAPLRPARLFEEPPRRSATPRRRRRGLATLAVYLGVGAGVAIASLPTRDAPTLGRSSGPRAAQSDARTTGLSAALTEPSGRPVQGGRYAFGPGRWLHVDTGGKTIRRLQASVACLGRIVLRDIPVMPDRSFATRLRAGKQRYATLAVEGRFVGVDRAQVILHASVPGCDSGKVRFAARLSATSWLDHAGQWRPRSRGANEGAR
jgi:hypothetical protein